MKYQKNTITLLFLFLATVSFAKTWEIGSAKTYTQPSQVMSLVSSGDSILINGGEYLGDVGTWNVNHLVILGINGRPHLKANGQSSQGKAIWVITGDSITIDNIEFSGCTVPDKNGAGIRAEGANLTIKNCYFHDNENGILSNNNSEMNIFVEFSEFGHNGYGDGYSHNIYVGHTHSFTMQYCYFHHAKIGHQVKSRAQNNFIKYNYLTDEAEGKSSSLLDLPNGGFSIVIGNIFFQGPKAENSRLISYGLEGLTNTYNKLRIVNNTLISERHTAIFFMIEDGADNVQIVNNILVGKGTDLQGPGTKINNIHYEKVDDAKFSDYDHQNYSPLKTSSAIDKSIDPGILDGIILTPASEYVHPISGIERKKYGVLDLGAVEYIWPVYNHDISNLSQNISPNPVRNTATLFLDHNLKHAILKILNINGQIVKTIHSNNQKSISIDRKNLDTGIYFFHLFDSGKIIGNGKFVVE